LFVYARAQQGGMQLGLEAAGRVIHGFFECGEDRQPAAKARCQLQHASLAFLEKAKAPCITT
jgi:hypothetical protein